MSGGLANPMRAAIANPIIVLGTPRSGTTILHRSLSMHQDLWHLPAESHAILEGPLHPRLTGYESNRATATEADHAVLELLRGRFYRHAINLNAVVADPSSLADDGGGILGRVRRRLSVSAAGFRSAFKKGSRIRFLEKTPKNSLRVPFLDRLFPDARYVWIQRNAAENVDSLIAGWHAVDRIGPFTRQRFAAAGYPVAGDLDLQDYRGKWWKFALVPEWRTLQGKTVADVAAWQYYQCNHFLLHDLAALDQRRVRRLTYEDFIRDPVRQVRGIFEWAELPPSAVAEAFAADLPRVNDATPGSKKASDGLRYGSAVQAALQRLPALAQLQAMLG
jgi:hypothetical protein